MRVAQLRQDQGGCLVRDAIDAGQQITFATQIRVIVDVVVDRLEGFLDLLLDVPQHLSLIHI